MEETEAGSAEIEAAGHETVAVGWAHGVAGDQERPGDETGVPIGDGRKWPCSADEWRAQYNVQWLVYDGDDPRITGYPLEEHRARLAQLHAEAAAEEDGLDEDDLHDGEENEIDDEEWEDVARLHAPWAYDAESVLFLQRCGDRYAYRGDDLFEELGVYRTLVAAKRAMRRQVGDAGKKWCPIVDGQCDCDVD